MVPITKAHIKQLVASDKLEEALDELSRINAEKPDVLNDVLAHRAALAKSRKDSRRGLISGGEENTIRTRVRFAILEDLLSPEEFPASVDDRGPEKVAKTKRVFVSYNHGDARLAVKVAEFLKSQGIGVTIDMDCMSAGQRIQEFIEQSIREADVVLSIVSNASLLSSWVAMETINSFHREKWVDRKLFVAGYADDDFFRPEFRLESTRLIDEKLEKIDQLVSQYVKEKIDTADLNDEKARLYSLRNNLGDILARLKGSLCLDLRDSQFDESAKKLVAAIVN